MQITYKDKVTLQSNPNIPDENKVTAKDMNEIKSVVNSNAEEQQALNMSVQEIAQNVINNSQEISNIKEEQATQNDNIQTNSNNISDLQSNKADKNEIPTDLSQLSNDNTKFVNETELENAIFQEKTQRQNADNNLQNQIDAITASTDVIDIVGTYQDLQDYDTSKVKQNDVIKVLQDSTHNNAMSYYRWQNQWIYVGSEGPYYTIGQTDELLQGKANQSDLNQTNTNVTKLAGRVSNNESKIENIEQEQTEQNTNISNNTTNIESLQEENENLKKVINQLPQVTGQGTEITLENTIEAQFTKFDVEGNSVQDGTPSPDNEVPILSAGDNENLFDGETITFNAYDNIETAKDGLVTTKALSNTGTSNVNIRFPALNLSPDTYYISMDIRIKSGTGDFVKLNDGATDWSVVSKPTISSSFQRYVYKHTYTAEKALNQILVQFSNNSNTVYEIERIMVSNIATPYSPYGMGSINEKIQNKNFFDIEKAVERFENWVGDSRSDWGTYENGVVNIVKSNGAHGYYGFAGQKFAFNKGASCTLSAEVLLEGTNSASGVRIGVEEREKDNTSIGSVKNIDIAKNKWTHITIIVSFTEAVTNARVQIEAANTGNTVQIKNIQLEQGSTATPYVPHEEQDYSIFVQQPMRSIGDVRDCFVKKDGSWYERHMPYIASYNGETLPQDVYNEVDNVKYCNEKSMSTTGQFSIGASVQYIDENNWNDLPCTEEQIQQLENLPSTYKEMTIIQSQDVTKAYLEVSGIRDINTMFDKITNAIVSLGGNV